MGEKLMGKEKIEDLVLIRDNAILQNLFTMLQKNGADLEFNRSILNKAYAMAGRYIEDRVLEDSKANRAALASRGVKIYREEYQDDFIIFYHYTSRGYTDKFGVTRDVLRSEISWRLAGYISELGQALKEARQHAKRP
ncbi:hypothetical protein J41TS12_41380 [Paenibacillus antibioticophila]|uniref:Uncharacterized protein n=1 Tax=Paenibacillus antibioticophila TaxID=1274374 RepID=A0A919XZ51_9BACL|nr:hypothetical protein [Paenibacillus antibioticophila]GIO39277.1 hypothetical protein J41TS12_41380 [Paenibacillus antibioticophila]